MVKIKRVAMILDNPLNPDPRVWRSAITLQKNGYDVTIFCQKEQGLSEYEEIEGVKIKRVFQYKLGTSVLIDKYLQAHFQLKEALDKEEKFDIFHCHDTETWPLGYIVAKEQDAKWIADSHEYFPDYIVRELYPDENKYNTAILLGKNRGEYIRYADAVITVSDSIATSLQEEFSLSCPVETIFNTRYTEHVIQESKEVIRFSYGFDNNEKIVVFAGNLNKDRGIEFVVEVISKLPKDFRLITIGEGYFSSFLKELQEKESRFVYLGKLPYKELIRYVYISDVYLYFPSPSIVEGCKNFQYTIPNKFFDAIFSNTPFYTYNRIGEMNEYLNRFGIGKGFDLDVSAEEVAKYIVENNEKLLLKGSFAKAQEYFSWGDQARKLKEIYEKLEGK